MPLARRADTSSIRSSTVMDSGDRRLISSIGSQDLMVNEIIKILSERMLNAHQDVLECFGWVWKLQPNDIKLVILIIGCTENERSLKWGREKSHQRPRPPRHPARLLRRAPGTAVLCTAHDPTWLRLQICCQKGIGKTRRIGIFRAHF